MSRTSRRVITLVILAAALVACQGAPATDPAPAATQPPAAASGAVAALAGETIPAEGGAYTRITIDTLAQALPGKDFYFVNTHIPYEGEIEQTDAFIPYDETLDRLDQYPADTDAPIVLYCRSGRMSAIAAEALVSAGYTNVYDVAGGFAAWKVAGHDVIVK
jgi:rhodanese-related sulfurtransferase